MNSYAWTIDKDHIDTGGKGTQGPSDAPDELFDRLGRGKGHTFKIYDDDDTLYYTGRCVWSEGHSPEVDEDTAVGPLRDYGTPNAGATLIKWHGKKSWTAEY